MRQHEQLCTDHLTDAVHNAILDIHLTALTVDRDEAAVRPSWPGPDTLRRVGLGFINVRNRLSWDWSPSENTW